MLGFYVSGHPLEKYASRLAGLKVVSLDQIEGQRSGKEITIAALVVSSRPMRSRKGARWAIFTIQDMTGIQELLAFPESFARLEQMLKPGKPLLMKVRVQVEEAGMRRSLEEARLPQDIADRPAASEIRLRLDLRKLSEEAMDQLNQLIEDAQGLCPVVCELSRPDGSVCGMRGEQC